MVEPLLRIERTRQVECGEYWSVDTAGMREKAAAVVVHDFEWRTNGGADRDQFGDALAVLRFELSGGIEASAAGRHGRVKLAGSDAAVAGRYGGLPTTTGGGAFERGEHLLGATGALVRDRENWIRHEEKASVGFLFRQTK
jgi:hypothetical protein